MRGLRDRVLGAGEWRSSERPSGVGVYLSGVAGRPAIDLGRLTTRGKTRDVFDRYHIVSPTDLKAAAQKRAGTTHGHKQVGSQGSGLTPVL